MPPHPTRALAVFLAIVGLLVVAAALRAHTSTVPVMGALVAALLVVLGVALARSGDAVQLVNAARECAREGDLERARGLLARAEAEHGWLVGRNAGLQRALLAWADGDLALVEQHATRVIDGPGSRWNAAAWVELALGLRALAGALRGDHERARPDVERLRGDPLARPEALARAELASALGRSGRDDLAALRADLWATSWLLFGFLPPRERILVRALFARAYQGERGERAATLPADRTEDEAWAARVAPWAVAHLGAWAIAPPRGEGVPDGAAVDAKAPAMPREGSAPPSAATRDASSKPEPRSGVGPRALRLLVFGAALVLLVVAATHRPSAGQPDADSTSPSPPTADIATSQPVSDSSSAVSSGALGAGRWALALVLLAAASAWVASSRAQQRRLMMGRFGVARGALEAVEGALAPLLRSGNRLLRASAELELARVKNRRAEFEASLSLAHEALRSLAVRARGLSVDLLMADLLVLRSEAAIVLGLSGHETGVDGRVLQRRVRQSAPVFDAFIRVRVLELAKGADWDGAFAAAADHGPDAWSDPRTMILLRALRAIVHRDERSCSELSSMLRDWPEGARWFERAVPGLAAALTEAS